MFFTERVIVVEPMLWNILMYTPKGLPPIRLKNRPINPGLIDALKEQIATWLKDGVICSGGISPFNFPLLPVQKKNGKWIWVVDF